MRGPLSLLVAVTFTGGCLLPSFEVEGKECDATEACPAGFFCVPRRGTERGVCSDEAPSCPGAAVGSACSDGEGACRRTGTLICTAEGVACSVLPGPSAEESCNGVDDDCDGRVDDSSGCVHSLAGAGPPGLADGPAESARFGGPGFITVASNGDLLIADTYAHAVRRVDAAGAVVTLAGLGRCGYRDGAPSEAELCLPGEVAEAADGTLYVSDTGNSRLRAIGTDGRVVTVAGTGTPGSSDGPALDAQLMSPLGLHVMADGSVAIADRDAHRVRRYAPGASPTLSTLAGTGVAGYLDGSRAQLQLDRPVDVVSPGGDSLYVVEAHLVRRLPEGGNSALLAGWNEPGFADNVFATGVRFNQPKQLTLSGGQLLLADALNDRLRGVDLANGATATLIGGVPGFRNGAGGATALRMPHGVAHLGASTWVFLDGNARLRKVTGDLVANTTVDFSGGSWLRQSADGDRGAARLSAPRGLTRTGQGELWWVEPEASLVRRRRVDGTVETVAGVVTAPGTTGFVNGAFRDARVSSPWDAAVGSDGRIFVTDRFNHAVRAFSPSTGEVLTLAGPVTSAAGLVNGTLAEARFSQPLSLTVGDDGSGGERIFVFDAGNRVIRSISPAQNLVATLAGTVGTAGSADGAPGVGQFGNVTDLCADGAGGVWALEGRRLRHVTASGTISTPLASLPFDAEVLVRESDGRLLLGGGERLARIDPSTGAVTSLLPGAGNRAPIGWVDGDLETAASFTFSGLAVTAEAIFWVDQQANRLRQLWR